jgi:ribosomal protein L16 Arg81 hydroxylase
MQMEVKQMINQEMTQYKIQMSEFFKGFVTNYTQELSRTSLTPLMEQIDIIKNVQSENLKQNVSHHSK